MATRQQEIEAFQRRRTNGIINPAQADDHGVIAQVGPRTVTNAIFAADVNSIRAFLASLEHHHYSAATLARKIATLRSFYRWMDKCGLVASNPMLMIRTPRQSKRLPKAIGVDQVEKLLSAPDDTDLLGSEQARLGVIDDKDKPR